MGLSHNSWICGALNMYRANIIHQLESTPTQTHTILVLQLFYQCPVKGGGMANEQQ